MAESSHKMNGSRLLPSFNPHHTGEWLKDIPENSHIQLFMVFQSSSYWRMAERTIFILLSSLIYSFNPHHTGEWLKVWLTLNKNFWIICFNPHHTGEWLKDESKSTQIYSIGVSILIILANGWKKTKSCCDTRLSSFNPHHTGEWLKVTILLQN